MTKPAKTNKTGAGAAKRLRESRTGDAPKRGRNTIAKTAADTHSVTVDSENWVKVITKGQRLTGKSSPVSDLLRQIGERGVFTKDGGLYIPPLPKDGVTGGA